MGPLGAWLIPPLIGAVIGYITNWLAIKMLFRPFAEVRLMGIRMPFTPGLLPRERKRISRSIGETVASELLTAEVVRKRLSEPDISAATATAIDERLADILASRAADVLPGKGLAKTAVGTFVAEAWTGAVSSEAFRSALTQALLRSISLAEKMPLSRFLPAEKAEELASLFLAPGNIDAMRARLSAFVDGLYEGKADEGAAGGLTQLVPPEAVEPLLEVLASGLYRAALPALEAFLDEPEVKRTMERYGREIVRNAIGRLNLLQRLIVGAAQYERGIAESMPQTIEDMSAAVIALLRSPRMPDRAGQAAITAFRNSLKAPFSLSLARIVSRETAKAALNAALDAVAEHGPGVAKRAAALASARAHASLASLVRSVGLPEEEMASRAAAAICRTLSGSEGGEDAARLFSGALAAFIEGLGRSLGEASLGEALGSSIASREALAEYLAGKVLDILAREAGRIVEGLDVSRIVQERIDELDMREMERIILDVAGKELKWITFLGGVLGGVIGLLQAAFLLL
jgi:hypothetical protein